MVAVCLRKFIMNNNGSGAVSNYPKIGDIRRGLTEKIESNFSKKYVQRLILCRCEILIHNSKYSR